MGLGVLTYLRLLVAAGALLWFAAVVSAPDQLAEIKHLLDYIEASEYRFERNGKFYDSEKAAEHIKDKYRHIQDSVNTAEQFIEHAATRSSISGNQYMVYCKDGRPIASAVWLRQELKVYRDEHK